MKRCKNIHQEHKDAPLEGFAEEGATEENRMDKLIDDIIELVLDDMDCHHEVDHDEDGTHMSVEYSLNNETKLRGKIGELIEEYGRIK